MPRSAEPLLAANVSPDNVPTLDAMHAMALDALESVPGAFRRHMAGLVIRLAEWPEEEVLDDMGIDSPYDLLGLYQGIALTERSINDVAPAVDMIFLYRQPILAYWEDTGLDLRDILRNTLVHEIGHHFGLSDDQMDALEEAAAAEDEKRRTA